MPTTIVIPENARTAASRVQPNSAVVVLLFVGVPFAAWAGLVLSLIVIVVSIFYYNPTIMIERSPKIADWIEDLVFTGLQFVVVTLLTLEVAGLTLA